MSIKHHQSVSINIKRHQSVCLFAAYITPTSAIPNTSGSIISRLVRPETDISHFAVDEAKGRARLRVRDRPLPDQSHHVYLTRSVPMILQKSIPTQIRRLILYIGHSEGSVDELVGELTSATRLYQYCL